MLFSFSIVFLLLCRRQVFDPAEIIMKTIVNICYALYKHSPNNLIGKLGSFSFFYEAVN